MTEEKRNRLVAAVTVNVILLVVILAAVCIYQLVHMITLKNLKSELNDKINYYEQQTDTNEKTLEYYKTEDALYDLALKYGWVSGK